MEEIELKVLEELKTRPIFHDTNEAYLKTVVKDALNDVLDFINHKGEELDVRIITPIKDLCIIRLNLTGNEGITSSGKGGTSESYLNDIPKPIKQKLKKYRNLP